MLLAQDLLPCAPSYGSPMSRAAPTGKPLLCHPCLLAGTPRPAWTVAGGAALCIRCAIEQHTSDDMDQHDLAATLYEALRLQGHRDVY